MECAAPSDVDQDAGAMDDVVEVCILFPPKLFLFQRQQIFLAKFSVYRNDLKRGCTFQFCFCIDPSRDLS